MRATEDRRQAERDLARVEAKLKASFGPSMAELQVSGPCTAPLVHTCPISSSVQLQDEASTRKKPYVKAVPCDGLHSC